MRFAFLLAVLLAGCPRTFGVLPNDAAGAPRCLVGGAACWSNDQCCSGSCGNPGGREGAGSCR